MRRLYSLVGRSQTIETYTVTTMLWVLIAAWTHVSKFMFFVDADSTVAFELPFQTALMATVGATFFVWMSLYIFGLVGGGSGAGFRLAILGLSARVLGSLIVVGTVPEPDGSNYTLVSQNAGPVWWVRNLGVLAFGWGIALVVIASGSDLVRRLRRRRRLPIFD